MRKRACCVSKAKASVAVNNTLTCQGVHHGGPGRTSGRSTESACSPNSIWSSHPPPATLILRHIPPAFSDRNPICPVSRQDGSSNAIHAVWRVVRFVAEAAILHPYGATCSRYHTEG